MLEMTGVDVHWKIKVRIIWINRVWVNTGHCVGQISDMAVSHVIRVIPKLQPVLLTNPV